MACSTPSRLRSSNSGRSWNARSSAMASNTSVVMLKSPAMPRTKPASDSPHNGIETTTTAAASTPARCNGGNTLTRGKRASSTRIASMLPVSPVRSVSSCIVVLFQMTVQPHLVECNVLDEYAVPGISEMNIAVVCLDQVGIGELEVAATVRQHAGLGGIDILAQFRGRCLRQARIGIQQQALHDMQALLLVQLLVAHHAHLLQPVQFFPVVSAIRRQHQRKVVALLFEM